MGYNKICEYCGGEFITDAKHQAQRFCSEPCRYQHRRGLARAAQRKKQDNIAAINEMARRKHLSYGKLKAMEYMEKARAENENN